MKKILIVFAITIICCACQKKELIEEHSLPSQSQSSISSIIPQYNDDNPIIVGLYDASSFSLVNDYYTSWVLNQDLLVFTTYYTNEPLQGTVGYYLKQYDSNYRIGYNIKFTLKNGTTIDKTILNITDSNSVYDYLQVYLYDDIIHENDAWYSHITEEEFNEQTLMTSIKLTGSTKIDEIIEPISLTVFTYDSDDDFIDNSYRGNSKYSVNIYKG